MEQQRLRGCYLAAPPNEKFFCEPSYSVPFTPEINFRVNSLCSGMGVLLSIIGAVYVVASISSFY